MVNVNSVLDVSLTGCVDDGTVPRCLDWEGVLPQGLVSSPGGVLVSKLIRELRQACFRCDPEFDLGLVDAGIRLALDAHSDQKRLSGEPFVTHPLAVANILAGLGVSAPVVTAAVCHDVLEDTGVTVDMLSNATSVEVARLVEAVSKIVVPASGGVDSQAATLQKMLTAALGDPRVVLIKSADRLHNMRTLGALPPEKQDRIALETREVYAPLAFRIGASVIARELEDLAFQRLEPEMFGMVSQLIARLSPQRDAMLTKVTSELSRELKAAGLECVISGRTKHVWSTYKKVVNLDPGDWDEMLGVWDLVGVRVVCENVRDCYATLGVVHELWRPLPNRFRDYIASPKFNLYQSLHVNVLGPGGVPVEIQIRTQEMHERATIGVAAHWAYKKGGPPTTQDLEWMLRLVEWQTTADTAEEYLEAVVAELTEDEIQVFTPSGEMVSLPAGATALDFAYQIHTDIGHGATGVKIDGQPGLLTGQLQPGVTVQVLGGRRSGPDLEWFRVVRTPRAREAIKRWFGKAARQLTNEPTTPTSQQTV